MDFEINTKERRLSLSGICRCSYILREIRMRGSVTMTTSFLGEVSLNLW